MIKKLALITGMGVALMAAIFLTGCNSLPDNAAATVNGVVISKDDVDYRIHILTALNPQKVPQQGTDDYKALQGQIADQLVSEEITRQEADKRGITVTPDEIESRVQQVVEDSYYGDANKMEQDFAKRGLSVADLRVDITRHLLYQKILDSLRAEVPVTDQEVQAAYDQGKSNYVQPERRQVRLIAVPDQASAASVASRINGGENMATLAQQISTDSQSRANGGMLGLVPKTSLPSAVGEAAFSLQQNQVSDPFKCDSGWCVVRVELIAPASNKTFDQVQNDLRTYLSNQKLAAHYQDYEQSIHQTYDVQFADGYTYTGTDTTATDGSDAAATPGTGGSDSLSGLPSGGQR